MENIVEIVPITHWIIKDWSAEKYRCTLNKGYV